MWFDSLQPINRGNKKSESEMSEIIDMPLDLLQSALSNETVYTWFIKWPDLESRLVNQGFNTKQIEKLKQCSPETLTTIQNELDNFLTLELSPERLISFLDGHTLSLGTVLERYKTYYPQLKGDLVFEEMRLLLIHSECETLAETFLRSIENYSSLLTPSWLLKILISGGEKALNAFKDKGPALEAKGFSREESVRAAAHPQAAMNMQHLIDCCNDLKICGFDHESQVQITEMQQEADFIKTLRDIAPVLKDWGFELDNIMKVIKTAYDPEAYRLFSSYPIYHGMDPEQYTDLMTKFEPKTRLDAFNSCKAILIPFGFAPPFIVDILKLSDGVKRLETLTCFCKNTGLEDRQALAASDPMPIGSDGVAPLFPKAYCDTLFRQFFTESLEALERLVQPMVTDAQALEPSMETHPGGKRKSLSGLAPNKKRPKKRQKKSKPSHETSSQFAELESQLKDYGFDQLKILRIQTLLDDDLSHLQNLLPRLNELELTSKSIDQLLGEMPSCKKLKVYVAQFPLLKKYFSAEIILKWILEPEGEATISFFLDHVAYLPSLFTVDEIRELLWEEKGIDRVIVLLQHFIKLNHLQFYPKVMLKMAKAPNGPKAVADLAKNGVSLLAQGFHRLRLVQAAVKQPKNASTFEALESYHDRLAVLNFSHDQMLHAALGVESAQNLAALEQYTPALLSMKLNHDAIVEVVASPQGPEKLSTLIEYLHFEPHEEEEGRALFDRTQLVKLLVRDVGLETLQRLKEDGASLVEKGFAPDVVWDIALSQNGHLKLAALNAHSLYLLASGFQPTELIKGVLEAQTHAPLVALRNHTQALSHLGFPISHQIRAVTGPNDAEGMETLLRFTPILNEMGFSLEEVGETFRLAHGARRIEALQEVTPTLQKKLQYTNSSILRIAQSTAEPENRRDSRNSTAPEKLRQLKKHGPGLCQKEFEPSFLIEMAVSPNGSKAIETLSQNYNTLKKYGYQDEELAEVALSHENGHLLLKHLAGFSEDLIQRKHYTTNHLLRLCRLKKHNNLQTPFNYLHDYHDQHMEQGWIQEDLIEYLEQTSLSLSNHLLKWPAHLRELGMSPTQLRTFRLHYSWLTLRQQQRFPSDLAFLALHEKQSVIEVLLNPRFLRNLSSLVDYHPQFSAMGIPWLTLRQMGMVQDRNSTIFEGLAKYGPLLIQQKFTWEELISSQFNVFRTAGLHKTYLCLLENLAKYAPSLSNYGFSKQELLQAKRSPWGGENLNAVAHCLLSLKELNISKPKQADQLFALPYSFSEGLEELVLAAPGLMALGLSEATLWSVALSPCGAKNLRALVSHGRALVLLGFREEDIRDLATLDIPMEAPFQALIQDGASLSNSHQFQLKAIKQVVLSKARVPQKLNALKRLNERPEPAPLTQADQIEVAISPRGDAALEAFLQYRDALKAQGLSDEEILKVTKSPQGDTSLYILNAVLKPIEASQTTPLTAHGFTLPLLVDIAASPTGDTSLTTLQHQIKPLLDLGYSIETLAQVAQAPNGAHRLTQLALLTPHLTTQGFNLTLLAELATHSHVQALEALSLYATPWRALLGWSPEHIARAILRDPLSGHFRTLNRDFHTLHTLGFSSEQIFSVIHYLHYYRCSVVNYLIKHHLFLAEMGFTQDNMTSLALQDPIIRAPLTAFLIKYKKSIMEAKLEIKILLDYLLKMKRFPQWREACEAYFKRLSKSTSLPEWLTQTLTKNFGLQESEFLDYDWVTLLENLPEESNSVDGLANHTPSEEDDGTNPAESLAPALVVDEELLQDIEVPDVTKDKIEAFALAFLKQESLVTPSGREDELETRDLTGPAPLELESERMLDPMDLSELAWDEFIVEGFIQQVNPLHAEPTQLERKAALWSYWDQHQILLQAYWFNKTAKDPNPWTAETKIAFLEILFQNQKHHKRTLDQLFDANLYFTGDEATLLQRFTTFCQAKLQFPSLTFKLRLCLVGEPPLPLFDWIMQHPSTRRNLWQTIDTIVHSNTLFFIERLFHYQTESNGPALVYYIMAPGNVNDAPSALNWARIQTVVNLSLPDSDRISILQLVFESSVKQSPEVREEIAKNLPLVKLTEINGFHVIQKLSLKWACPASKQQQSEQAISTGSPPPISVKKTKTPGNTIRKNTTNAKKAREYLIKINKDTTLENLNLQEIYNAISNILPICTGGSPKLDKLNLQIIQMKINGNAIFEWYIHYISTLFPSDLEKRCQELKLRILMLFNSDLIAPNIKKSFLDIATDLPHIGPRLWTDLKAYLDNDGEGNDYLITHKNLNTLSNWMAGNQKISKDEKKRAYDFLNENKDSLNNQDPKKIYRAISMLLHINPQDQYRLEQLSRSIKIDGKSLLNWYIFNIRNLFQAPLERMYHELEIRVIQIYNYQAIHNNEKIEILHLAIKTPEVGQRFLAWLRKVADNHRADDKNRIFKSKDTTSILKKVLENYSQGEQISILQQYHLSLHRADLTDDAQKDLKNDEHVKHLNSLIDRIKLASSNKKETQFFSDLLTYWNKHEETFIQYWTLAEKENNAILFPEEARSQFLELIIRNLSTQVLSTREGLNLLEKIFWPHLFFSCSPNNASVMIERVEYFLLKIPGNEIITNRLNKFFQLEQSNIFKWYLQQSSSTSKIDHAIDYIFKSRNFLVYNCIKDFKFDDKNIFQYYLTNNIDPSYNKDIYVKKIHKICILITHSPCVDIIKSAFKDACTLYINNKILTKEEIVKTINSHKVRLTNKRTIASLESLIDILNTEVNTNESNNSSTIEGAKSNDISFFGANNLQSTKNIEIEKKTLRFSKT